MGKRFTSNQKGFTLIDLLMVITISGVLVGIVAPAVGGTGNLGTEAQVESDGKETQSAVDRYHNSAAKPDQWPEQAFGLIYKDPAGGSRKFLDLDGNTISNVSTTHRELKANAQTTTSGRGSRLMRRRSGS
jgi:prepilin-type N-terminal cleavage/methylation domain-containing protein